MFPPRRPLGEDFERTEVTIDGVTRPPSGEADTARGSLRAERQPWLRLSVALEREGPLPIPAFVAKQRGALGIHDELPATD